MPGNLEESELVARITAEDETDRMPPKSLGRTLTTAEIELLKRWIEQGAEWKDHWAFIPPGEVPLPEVKHTAWPRNAIDRFVLARLEAEGLSPSPEASKERLIRRVTFDLTGLPPTLAEIDAFLADRRPDAYERLVDRLLASPRFGERMTVDWLDVARYADTFGYQADVYRAMWPWRDWVVKAFNTNLPFDRFITWQLAGDLLPNPSSEQVLATAFNRHHRQTNEGGSIEEEWRTEYVADRTITFGAAFLGLTLECSRCHNHKYDPITQKDFYSLFSFFNSIDESGLYSHFTDAVPTPTMLLTTKERLQSIAEAERKIKDAEAEAGAARPDAIPDVRGLASRAESREPRMTPIISGQIGDFPLDEIKNLKVENRADPAKPGQVVRGTGGGRGADRQGPEAQRREQRHAPPGEFRPLPAVLDRALDQDARQEGSRRRPSPLPGLDRRRQPGLRDPDRGRQAVCGPGPLLARQRDRDQDQGAASRSTGGFTSRLTYDGSSRASGLTLYQDGQPGRVRGRPRLADQEHHRRRRRRADRRPAVPRPRLQERPGRRAHGLRPALTPIEVAQLHDHATLTKTLAKILPPSLPGSGTISSALLPRQLRRRVSGPACGPHGTAKAAQLS